MKKKTYFLNHRSLFVYLSELPSLHFLQPELCTNHTLNDFIKTGLEELIGRATANHDSVTKECPLHSFISVERFLI